MSKWIDLCNEVKERGFVNSSPLARLVWSCEVGQIDQHASDDLMSIVDELAALRAENARLRAIAEAAEGMDKALSWFVTWDDNKLHLRNVKRSKRALAAYRKAKETAK